MAQEGYAGDVDPAEAWKILESEPDAVLIDVRTDAEWAYVGLPNLRPVNRALHCIPWQLFPTMALNPHFVEQVAGNGVRPEQTVLLICRSGVRSRHAAIALTRAGFSRCLNVADGFEGPSDAAGHRGGTAGWKATGLPWSQQ